MTKEAESGCDCRDWQENIGYLHDMVLLRWTHGGKGYQGKPFVFCPWCGSPLLSTPEQHDEDVPADDGDV